MSLKRPRCSSCPYWRKDRFEEGTCQRFPPAYVGPMDEDYQSKLHCNNWYQPITSIWESCGEHPAYRAFLADPDPNPDSDLDDDEEPEPPERS